MEKSTPSPVSHSNEEKRDVDVVEVSDDEMPPLEDVISKESSDQKEQHLIVSSRNSELVDLLPEKDDKIDSYLIMKSEKIVLLKLPGRGRGFLAKEDIEAGTVILDENPVKSNNYSHAQVG